MRVVVAGMGVQGRKRKTIAAADVVATVDPVVEGVDHKRIEDVNPASYDAVLLCVPDPEKPTLLPWLLERGKHVLVEKPLELGDGDFVALEALSRRHGALLQVGYNHRYEPHVARMRETLASGVLGRIYYCRFFYGNGTARDVRNSAWRDQGSGVVADLASHLLDTAWEWFGDLPAPFKLISAHRFENRAPDHAVMACGGGIPIEMEVSLVSWRNHFSALVVGEKGSAEIDSLCKWGPSSFSLRTRVLPSGRPPEECVTLVQPDPSWALEYAHFKKACQAPAPYNSSRDRRIACLLEGIAKECLA